LANRLTEKERYERDKAKAQQKIDNLVNQPAKKEPEKMKIKHDGGIVIQGVENLLVRISRCCNPVPGDAIVGYITKGRGISIHRADCPNVANQKDVENRLIEVEWEDTANNLKEYNADLEIYGYNRDGLLNDVLQTVSSMSKSLVSVEAKPTKDKMAMIHLTLGIQNIQHLRTIVDKIKTVPDVYSVRRTNG
jgi:GTP pyrophosphokinase